MNTDRLKDAVRTILEEVGEDVNREGIRETPDRVVKMFAEIYGGLQNDPPDLKVFTNSEGYDQMIIVKEIPFYSTCEHHLVPFFGTASVAYIPTKKYVGLSKIARTVEHFARKPQVQERLTQEVADYLFGGLEPLGLMVVIKARHLCMESRGIKKPGAETITSVVLGEIDKEEFLSFLGSVK